MFGLRRQRQLKAEIAVLTAALDFYAINDNWRRRARHVKGRQWEMSVAAKDHGARAREALLKARDINRLPLTKLLDQVREWFRAKREAREVSLTVAHAADYLKNHGVTAPAPSPAPLALPEPVGDANVLP